MAMSLSQSYRWVFVALAATLLVELICFRRLRRCNGWLTMLAGSTVGLQTVIVVTWVTCTRENAATLEAILRVCMLGFTGMAAVSGGLALHRIWAERARSRAPMAWLRAASFVLLGGTLTAHVLWGLFVVGLLAGRDAT
jgi:multisubunit Na+/H+ antiporter MnhF subunit